MKLRNLFYATFAMTMVACTQENSFLSQDETGVLRTISSGSGKFASRSVVDSKWEQNDAIGVFMLKSDASSTYAENVKFTNNTAEANTKVTFTSETGITLVNDKVKFHAYYPWSDTNVTGTTYNVQISDQTELTNVSNSDLRWAVSDEKDLTNRTLEGGLSLNFAHKLTFLKVKTNVADVKSVSVSGVNTEAQFNIVDGTLSNEAGNTKSIQLCKTTINEQEVYCGIVVPTTELKDFVIKIVATEEGKDMVYQYVYGSNNTLEGGLKGGWQYLFNITLDGSTGSATLDKIEAELGGFEGDDTPVNGEVSNPEEAVTDITVPAGTDLNGLKALLEGKSGKISLNFADGTYDLGYTDRNVIEIPNNVTGISFVGSNSNTVKLKIAKIKWEQDLQELRFENVEIEGHGSDYFMNDGITENGVRRTPRFAEGGIVEFKSCYVHGANRLFYWKGNVTKNTLASFVIDDCIMVGAGNQVLEGYDTAKMIYKNSTFLNWSCLGKITQKTTPVEFDIQNCTLANLSATGFEGGSGSTAIFKDNIVVNMPKDNTYILYGLNVTDASGNIMDNQDKVGSLTVNTNVEIKNTIDILPDYTLGATAVSDGMFVPASGIEAGDPRW